MSPKNTRLWLMLAAGLFAFIYIVERNWRTPAPGPNKVLPSMRSEAVTGVQVLPEHQLAIRAERTNGGWQLRLGESLIYPAQSASIENFLDALARLTPAAYIPGSDLRDRPNADEEYGFATPQDTLILEGDFHTQIQLGSKTFPGDQVFLQRVGDEGVFVVDAEFLKLVPHSANDWRDPTLIDLKGLPFDRVGVTNGAIAFGLERDPSNHLWRILPPIQARANSARVEDALENLQNVRANQFIAEDPKPDLEALGLQPPVLQLALGQGTNTAAVLQFGNSPTNDAAQVYARRLGQNSIVTVSNNLLAPWRGKIESFQDPHLVELAAPVAAIEVWGEDTFTVQRQSNNLWRVLPQDFPADAGAVEELLSDLTQLQAVLVKGVVIGQDLPGYGLAPPPRRYILKSALDNAASGPTNTTIAELDFGANQEDKVFAQRADEIAVYAVSLADFQRLPAASWQLRQRRIWNVSTNELAGVTIRQGTRVRQIIRRGLYDWALAPGSQGSIEPLRTEETVRGLCGLAAVAWVARGQQNRARYGFSDEGYVLVLDLKNGENRRLELGGEGPSTFPYAGVTLDGEFWIFQLAPLLCRDVLNYLALPAD